MRSISYYNNFEVFEEWNIFNPILKSNLSVSSIEDLLIQKTKLNRVKDQNDIRILKKLIR